MGKRNRRANSGGGSPVPGAGSENSGGATDGTATPGNRSGDDNPDAGSTVDLAAIGADSGGGDRGTDESPRRKRAYTPRRTGAAKETLALTTVVAENLFACHTYLAALTGKDILRIEQTEADALGGAINNVARHYDIPGVSQKTVDWIALARTLGMVYGMRLFALGMFAKTAPKVAAPPEAVKAAEPSPGKPPQGAAPPPGKVQPYPGGPFIDAPALQ